MIFEGEYITDNNFNQRWNGNGEEYDDKCALIFKGEYKEGKRWNGEATEYDPQNNLIIVIEYEEGKMEGYIKEKNNEDMEEKITENKKNLIKETNKNKKNST